MQCNSASKKTKKYAINDIKQGYVTQGYCQAI